MKLGVLRFAEVNLTMPDSSAPWVKSMIISKLTDTKPPQLSIELCSNAVWIHGVP